MALPPNAEWAVRDFSRALQADKAAVFVGAGLSIASGFATWRGLLAEPARRLGLVLTDGDDLPTIAQWFVNSSGGNRTTLNQLIIDAFVSKAKLGPSHEVLAQLPLTTIWTTNYDSLIESAFADRTVAVKTTDASLSTDIAGSELTIYKMHGTVSDAGVHDVVLTADDFSQYRMTHPGLWAALVNQMMSRTFLFLGYSFRDPNLHNVLAALKYALKDNVRRHLVVQLRESESEAATRQSLWADDLRRFGIDTVLVDDAAAVPIFLQRVLDETLRDRVFVTGSHADLSPELKEFAFQLGRSLAASGFTLVYAQSEGVSKNNWFGFLDHLIAEQQEFLSNRVQLYPYLYNPDLPTGPKATAVDTLKRAILRRVGTCIALCGGAGTAHELSIAKDLGRRVLPVGRFGGTSQFFLRDEGEYLGRVLSQTEMKVLNDDSISPEVLIDLVKRGKESEA